LRVDTMIVTYNSMGGHRAISYAGALLLGPKPPSFGTAISLIEVYCHIDGPEPPAPTLGPLLTRYRARVKTMPLGTFYRQPKRVELALHSSLRPKKRLVGYDPSPASPADVAMVRTVYTEIASTFDLLRRKVKTTDDFDVERFLSYIRERAAELHASSAKTVLGSLHELRVAEQMRVAANRPSNNHALEQTGRAERS
jgi:hypothetical protein